MQSRVLLFALALFLCIPELATSQDGAKKQAEQMAEMMELFKKWAAPDKHHKELEYFLGTWDTTFKVTMPGTPATPPEKGIATFSWVIDGLFMGQKYKGTMMGMPSEGFGITGFDRFKKKWVSMWCASNQTSMLTMEGVVVDPTGKVTSLYGTLDEFMTGEHDKAVRYTTRRVNEDKFTFEIWDLGIGAEGAKVMEFTYTRRK